MEQILQQVREYIREKQANKTWQAGRDFVNYAGAYYNEDEFVAGVGSLLNGWLAMGDQGLQFERQFPKQFGKTKGIVTNSGSSSNLLMMSALTSKRGYNLPKGTKVLMPIAGFPTTLNPTLQVGFVPVFVDIELETLNLDTTQLEKILMDNPDIRVITFAHVLGNPPNMDEVMRVVNKYNLILLEDCCDALGSIYDGKPLGSFGLMASCSFCSIFTRNSSSVDNLRLNATCKLMRSMSNIADNSDFFFSNCCCASFSFVFNFSVAKIFFCMLPPTVIAPLPSLIILFPIADEEVNLGM